MTGLELVVGYLIAWAVRKARRVGQRADAEVDQALDAGMDRLHDLVAGKLVGDPALAALKQESAGGEVSRRTRQRVQLSLEEASESDEGFKARLDELLAQVQEADRQAGAGVAVASEHGVAVVGGVSIRAEGGSVAAWTVGNVTVGGTAGPREPGRTSG
jgi:hypothetical protein